MLVHGTTTVEAKSGYGLDFDTEIKCLEAALELDTMTACRYSFNIYGSSCDTGRI